MVQKLRNFVFIFKMLGSKGILTPLIPDCYVLAADEIGLTGLWFEGQKYYMDKIIEDFEEKKDLPVLDQAEYWLDRYFAGQDPDPEELPLAPAGSDFRKEVWKIIAKIPYGCTITYGKIAKILAVKRGAKSISPQAVGGAVGHF